MLRLEIPQREYFNDKTSEFITLPKQTLILEHSLISLSKWESKWNKPFLDNTNKTMEETIDYIKCMTVNTNVDPMVYTTLPRETITQINEYITSPQTATWFSEDPSSPPNREITTSEILYYQMIELGIPFECEKWHINRLTTLIRVCSIKRSDSKKMSCREILSRNKELNAARKAKYQTKG